MARLFPIVLTLVMLAGSIVAGHPNAAATPSHGPAPVIYDSDMDFDDATTLAYLCEEHKQGHIALRAVTVANNGFGLPGRALRHARSVLEQCGLPWIPLADGGTGQGVHPAPAEVLPVVEAVLTDALGDAGRPAPPSRIGAADLIRLIVATSPARVTVLTTGPLTNLAAALRPGAPGSAWLAGRIDRIYTMGGAINVPGNLFGSALPGFDNSQEFNIWLDPAAARDVLRAARPGSVHLIPLDATEFVPITTDFVARMAADRHTPGARVAYRIISHPEMTALIEAGVMFWWDMLAALAAFRNDAGLTTFRGVRITVVQQGEQSGRTAAAPDGSPLRAAFTADRARFEQTFLDALNRRIPARTG